MQTRPLALAAGLVALELLSAGPTLAQKRIPKLPGYDECPLGYVNDLKRWGPLSSDHKPKDLTHNRHQLLQLDVLPSADRMRPAGLWHASRINSMIQQALMILQQMG